MQTAATERPARASADGANGGTVLHLSAASRVTGIPLSTLSKWVRLGLLPVVSNGNDHGHAAGRVRKYVTLEAIRDADRQRDERMRRPHLADTHRATHERHRAEFETYKRERGLLDSREIAERAACHHHHPARLVSQGAISARHYPGPWVGQRPPLLFAADVPDRIRALTDERERQGREATVRCLRAWWAARRAAGDFSGSTPRRGTERPCACGCGQTVYLMPWRVRAGDPGFASLSCWNQHRWRDPALRARMFWAVFKSPAEAGRLAKAIATAKGKRVGKPSKTLKPAIRARILELHGKGLSQRQIAYREGVSRGAVRYVLDQKNG